jgi:hypothetical protein
VRLIMIAAALWLAAASTACAEGARFTAMDQTAVRVYFATNPVVWMGLPGDLAREFARGKPLPRGVEAMTLPRALLSRLPARSGYDYVRVGDNVALVERTTRLVADIIENIFD